MGKFFIKGAIKHPGALTRSAKAAGESPMQFAEAHKDSSGKTGQRARFALLLRGFNKGKGSVRHKIGKNAATKNDNEIGHSTPANITLGGPNRPEGTKHGGKNAQSPRGQSFGKNTATHAATRQDRGLQSGGTKPARTLTSTGGDGVVY